MAIQTKLQSLISRFREHQTAYESTKYNETQVRREFIDPLFQLLGWDIHNERGLAPAYKDVVHEDAIKIEASTKAPDYAFRIGGSRKFFLEAKKPSVNIKDDVAPAYQLRRYAWSAKLPISILTDFEEFAIYDCRIKPEKADKASTARLVYFRFDEYPARWDELNSLVSKDAVLNGSLEKYAQLAKSKRGIETVDEAFLKEIEGWREALARNLALRNPELSVRELNTAVQRTIDRIIFLRIAEDRGIEQYGRLEQLNSTTGIYVQLCRLFQQADDRYNSGLFHFKSSDGSQETLDKFSLSLKIDDEILRQIIKGLYFPDSPYEFSVLPADILGQVYEQFLGKVIRLSGKSAVVEEKPEVKKAGGVYYTPTYIVQHIVTSALGPLLEGKSPAEVSGDTKRASRCLRIIDPACGSGSFLIQAYEHLLNWYRDAYVREGAEKHARGRNPRLFEAVGKDWRLTINEKRRILLSHIFGVDVDAQAVEVTKLSLLLKVLEGESSDAIARQMDLFHLRALPDLASNIRCGNSLISSDFYEGRARGLFDGDDLFRINAFDWPNEFPDIAANGGFDAVIGNPPWISLTGKFRNEIYTDDERNYLIRTYAGNSYMPNMYEYFIAKGLSLVGATGLFGFIVPDRFAYNDQFIELRKRILREHTLHEVLFRAPFPNVTADTLIFRIGGSKAGKGHQTLLGEFAGDRHPIEQKRLMEDERARFEFRGGGSHSSLIDGIMNNKRVARLEQIVQTTSGVGGKSKLISPTRISQRQIEVLKGESIFRYIVDKPFFFEFVKANITGRTTDKTKLGARPKILIRKTGNALIAAYDDTGTYPEQSLYFTYGPCAVDEFYLLGLLNSRLINFIYYNVALTNRDSIAQAKKVDLDRLPIIVSQAVRDQSLIKNIADAAREITSLVPAYYSERSEQKRTLLRRRVESLERRIDAEVIDLYGLSKQDAATVGSWDGQPKILR